MRKRMLSVWMDVGADSVTSPAARRDCPHLPPRRIGASGPILAACSEVQWKLLHEHEGQRTSAVVLETGDEVAGALRQFATRFNLRGSQFTGIGAFEDVVLGYFDWTSKEYQRIPIQEQVEVLALVGDIGVADGEPRLHAHVVVGKRDGTAHGGHLLEAHVRPTLEVVIVESPAHLERRFDAKTGLSLIRFE